MRIINVTKGQTVPSSELVKGDRVLLKSGWEATVMDKRVRGVTALCDVEGDYREIGSVYVADIMGVQRGNDVGSIVWQGVTHTDKQVKAAAAFDNL